MTAESSPVRFVVAEAGGPYVTFIDEHHMRKKFDAATHTATAVIVDLAGVNESSEFFENFVHTLSFDMHPGRGIPVTFENAAPEKVAALETEARAEADQWTKDRADEERFKALIKKRGRRDPKTGKYRGTTAEEEEWLAAEYASITDAMRRLAP